MVKHDYEPAFKEPGDGGDGTRGFTPGPWAAVPHEPGELRLKRRFWQIGQERAPNRGVGFAFGDDDANARLIAAAPDLLRERDELRVQRDALEAEVARLLAVVTNQEARVREYCATAAEPASPDACERREIEKQRDALADALYLTLGALHRCEATDIIATDFLPETITARSLAALRFAGRLQ